MFQRSSEVEQLTVNQLVVGSIPTAGANNIERVMAVRKPFEKDLYDKFDNPAKDKLVFLLEKNRHTIKRVAENYYSDVVSERDGIVYYSEAEVKRGWKSEWPTSWSEIRIPERKSRLLKKYDNKVNFFIFNHDLSFCWFIKGTQLTTDRLRQAYGNKILDGELFFHVPYQEAYLIRL